MKAIKSIGLLVVLGLISASKAFSQKQDKYLFSNKIVDLQCLYNYHIPSGDWAKTYGNLSSIGFGPMLKTKNNWLIGAEINYLFGQQILQTNILDNLITSSGYISNTNGVPGNYSVNMRGLSLFAKGGRLFGTKKFNMNTGILLLGGVGYMNHRINFQNQEGNIPPLDANYKVGYDRFTSGLALSQFVGYMYHSQNRFVNLYIGMEFYQAFTQNRRGFNYDTGLPDTGNKLDLSTSFRFGWTFPIYINTSAQDEYQFR